MRRQKVYNVVGHSCSLPKTEDLVCLYINGGLFVDFRRKFREFLMVHDMNPESKSVLRSTAQIRLEERKHLRNYYYMVHPFSRARESWEAVMIVIYCISFLVLPLDSSLTITPGLILYSKFLCDIFSWFDILFFLCTGYFDRKTRRIVMSPKKVIKRYIFSYFWFDVLGSLPVNMMYITYMGRYDLENLKLVMLFRLLRVTTMTKYIEKFIKRMGLWSSKFRLVPLVIWLVVIIWWITALNTRAYATMMGYTFSTPQESKIPLSEMLLNCLHDVIKVLTLTEISHFNADKTIMAIYQIICIYSGMVISLMIFVRIEQIYTRLQSSENNYNKLIQEVDHYMGYKELPFSLKKRILNFLHFRYQRNTFKEKDIMRTLSTLLKEEVLLSRTKSLLQNVDCFTGLSDALMLRVISRLYTEIFMANDTIVRAGETGHCMYFICSGTVAVYSEENDEICHLEDGNHFGEIALIINEPRVATVVAVTNCELFKLTRKDFMDALGPFPKVYEKVREATFARLRRLLIHDDD